MPVSRHVRLRKRADKLITRWGTTAVLRRSTGDRSCIVLEDSYSSRDIDGVNVLQGDLRYLVSALSPEDGEPLVPPDEQEDELIVGDLSEDSITTVLRIVEKPGRLAPGPSVIYYELHCRER